MEARCAVCGKRPAALVKVERNVGMVLMHRRHFNDGPFCRDHAMAAARQYLGKTLVGGWWGTTSFFINFKAVAVNIAAMKTARELPPAEGE